MFNIVDRYILTRFSILLLFIVLAGVVIFLSVDLIENLDKFIDQDVKWRFIVEYYLYFIPYIVFLIFPVTILLTTLFSLGGLAAHNEIIALKASGVSIYRILLVLAIPALIISCLLLGFNETVVPYFNKLRLDIYRHQVRQIPLSSTTHRGRIYLLDGKIRYVFIGNFNGETLSAFSIVIQTVQNNLLISRVDAKLMKYLKNYWILYDAVKRDFFDSTVTVEKIPSLEWRELGFKPDDLLRIQSKPEEMNYKELKEFVQKLRATGADALRWRVDLQDKVATPFAAFIIVIFGVPIAVVKRRSGLMVGFGISLVVCFLYFGAVHSGKILGYKGLVDPLISAWGGHVIFGVIGIISVMTTKK